VRRTWLVLVLELVLELVPKRCVSSWLREGGEYAVDACYSGVAACVGDWWLVG
jgi:hypothetical protein